MKEDFTLFSKFIGYITKADKTNIDSRALVTGSQNVLINDAEKVESRKGYEIYGPANTNNNAIESSFDWNSQRGGERTIRSYDDELVCLYTKDDDSVVEVRIADGWSAVDFSFARWWDTTETLEVLLFVVGDANIYEWSGGIAEIDSVTANTITKKGTSTWAQEGFYTAGNKTIIIDGTEYAYTGGEGTTTLTGVTPDPTSQPVASGDVATQKIVTNTNKPVAGFQNDFIIVNENQLYVGNTVSNLVYVSTNSDYASFSVSSPRVPGEGELFTLDSKGRGFGILQQEVVIFAGLDDIYKTKKTQLDVSGTLTEVFEVKKMKSGSQIGAKHHNLIGSMGNAIMYISNEPALRILEVAETAEQPYLKSVSNPIKPDFDAEDFTNGHIKFHKNRVYISAPNSNKVYINEVKEDVDGNLTRFWQPPQILPVRQFAIIGGDIYGHSGERPETYKLFTGTTDNGLPYRCNATFPYMNFGTRMKYKEFTQWAFEGYVQANTVITQRLAFEFGGSNQVLEREIDGSDADLTAEGFSDASLGQEAMGDEGLGGGVVVNDALPKLRQISEFPRETVFEVQPSYETNDEDAQWELLSHGPVILESPKMPTIIKR